MDVTVFKIDFCSAIGLTEPQAVNLQFSEKPRWSITGGQIRKIPEKEGCFEAEIQILESDLNANSSHEELAEFREWFLDCLGFSLSTRFQLTTAGCFCFRVHNGAGKITSFTDHCQPQFRRDLDPLDALFRVFVTAAPYREIIRFMRTALNADHPLVRFMNLAIAVDLLVQKESSYPGSRSPQHSCGHEISTCPKCKKSWTIPSSLRNRLEFLLPDELAARFIKARNNVVHGLVKDLHQYATTELIPVYREVFVTIRNYIGNKIGVSQITIDDLGDDIYIQRIMMDVHYQRNSEG